MKLLFSLCAAAALVGTAAWANDRATCENDRTHCDEQQNAHPQRAQVKRGKDVRTSYQANDDTAKVEQGAKNASNAVVTAADEALHPSHSRAPEKGELKDGRDVRNSLTTNPIGLLTGDGVNLQLEKPFADKWSGVVSGRYARASAGAGSTTAFGATGGVDFFITGRRNEGLSIGPRLNLGAGSSTVATNSLLGQVGVAGELGYNWIASNGITAGAAGGMGVNVGGGLNAPGSGNGLANAAPYGKVNLGYSW